MPRTRSLAWSELKIGVLTIIAIVAAAVLIFSLTGSRGFFWQRYSLKTRFNNVAGLAPGSPVRVAGVEVGSVTAMRTTGPSSRRARWRDSDRCRCWARVRLT
jgi:phospholipid/cholesterol/gamma-HCH transport system substrate-binding protein